MSLIQNLQTAIKSTERTTIDPGDDLAVFVVRFRCDALRRAMLVSEPENLAEAAIHAGELRHAVGAIPVNDPALKRRLEIMARALETIGRTLEVGLNAPGAAGDITKHARKLVSIDSWYAVASPKVRLAWEGAALERAILASSATSLPDICWQADIISRWARDLFHEGAAPPEYVRHVELVEQGAEALSRGLHSLAGLPAPVDAPAFEFLASA